MKLKIWYWVENYENITGLKDKSVVDITGDDLFRLSHQFDVAIMTNKHDCNSKILAIDELGRKFRQR
jgi:hypothetical protein